MSQREGQATKPLLFVPAGSASLGSRASVAVLIQCLRTAARTAHGRPGGQLLNLLSRQNLHQLSINLSL
jgi:hypothetical protein